jgi:hypothetical protein
MSAVKPAARPPEPRAYAAATTMSPIPAITVISRGATSLTPMTLKTIATLN